MLGLPEQVICHGYGVKAGESLRHLTMNGALQWVGAVGPPLPFENNVRRGRCALLAADVKV